MGFDDGLRLDVHENHLSGQRRWRLARHRETVLPQRIGGEAALGSGSRNGGREKAVRLQSKSKLTNNFRGGGEYISGVLCTRINGGEELDRSRSREEWVRDEEENTTARRCLTWNYWASRQFVYLTTVADTSLKVLGLYYPTLQVPYCHALPRRALDGH